MFIFKDLKINHNAIQRLYIYESTELFICHQRWLFIHSKKIFFSQVNNANLDMFD